MRLEGSGFALCGMRLMCGRDLVRGIVPNGSMVKKMLTNELAK